MSNYFASNLKYLRQRQNLSQDEMAAVIGKTRSMIGYYENGSSIPDLTILTALADYFQLKLDELTYSDLRNTSYTLPKPSIVQEPTAEYGNSSESYLRQIIRAKDETIRAKEAEIKVLQDLIAELREKNRSLAKDADKKR
ncbi:MAG: helix-turn-helix domain-containing protein [Microscillaceae bacterium]|nr:helix-turn-helix domain-containing protein [Microscillaceae bacterium]